jgi:hypothetical protein
MQSKGRPAVVAAVSISTRQCASVLSQATPECGAAACLQTVGAHANTARAYSRGTAMFSGLEEEVDAASWPSHPAIAGVKATFSSHLGFSLSEDRVKVCNISQTHVPSHVCRFNQLF